MVFWACSAGSVMIATPARESDMTGAEDRDLGRTGGAQGHHPALVFELDHVGAFLEAAGTPIQLRQAVWL